MPVPHSGIPEPSFKHSRLYLAPVPQGAGRCMLTLGPSSTLSFLSCPGEDLVCILPGPGDWPHLGGLPLSPLYVDERWARGAGHSASLGDAMTLS